MTVLEFSIASPDEGPYGIAAVSGPSAATGPGASTVWATLVHAGQIVRLSADGCPERFDLGSPECRPSAIVAGPDGAVWFTRSGDDKIGRIAADGNPAALPVSPGGGPYGLCIGPDDALWFTLMNTGRVGRLTPEGEVTEYVLPISDGFPAMITAAPARKETSGGPEAALWFTLNRASAIGRIDLQGNCSTYRLPTGDSGPVGISAGPESVWFAELLAGQIGRIHPDGMIEEFPLADRTARPHAVAATADGGCWVTLWAAAAAIRLDSNGVVCDEVRFEPGSEPHGLALAADGSLWVALESGRLVQVPARPADLR